MKKALLFCLGISFLLVSTAIQAQSQREIWYWAWRSYDLEVENPEDQRGDLLAFTPDGTVNVLLEEVFPIALERIDDTTAFVGGKIDDTYSYYYLTPTQAIPVLELFNQSYVDEMQEEARYNGGYSYLMPNVLQAGNNRFLLVDTKRDIYTIADVSENVTTPIELGAVCEDNCVRISQDGRYIRYRVMSPENLFQYRIYEHDTQTDIERLVYEQEWIQNDSGRNPPRAECTPDQFGEKWYCELYLDDDVNLVFVADEKIIIHTNGSIENINLEWVLRILDGRWYFLDLDRFPGGCDDCTVTVYPYRDEGSDFEFYIPSSHMGNPSSFNAQLLSEEYLGIGFTFRTAYAVSRSGELTELGTPHCCTDPTSMDFYDETFHYLVSYNQTTKSTQIWDTRSLTLIGTFAGAEITPGVGSTFRDYGLVVYNYGTGYLPHAVYSYLDERLFIYEYPTGTEGYSFHIDAFPGGTLLASYGDDIFSWWDSNYRVEGDGIYLWTPDDRAGLIIDGAIPIPDYPLR
jgi:hypothetical protein